MLRPLHHLVLPLRPYKRRHWTNLAVALIAAQVSRAYNDRSASCLLFVLFVTYWEVIIISHISTHSSFGVNESQHGISTSMRFLQHSAILPQMLRCKIIAATKDNSECAALRATQLQPNCIKHSCKKVKLLHYIFINPNCSEIHRFRTSFLACLPCWTCRLR